MELKQLEYFHMVARLNHFRRAAEALHVAQPSVSVAIQKLEAELGVSLIDRSNKQIRLTTEGTVFFQRVADILQKLQQAVEEVHDLTSTSFQTLRIGIPPMIGTFLFPRLLLEFRQAYPNIKLEITEEGSVAIQERIEESELDLGIIVLSEVGPDLETLTVWESEVQVALSREHPLAKHQSLSITELGLEPLILLKEGFYNRRLVLDRFEAEGLKPVILLSSNQLETIQSLLAHNLGISFLFREIIAGDSRLSGVSLVPPVSEPIGLAWKKDKCLPVAARSFIDFIMAR